VAYTDQLPQLPLKLLDARASVGEPTAVHDFTDPLQETLFVTDVRTADVKLLFEALPAAEDGEIIQAFLCEHVKVVSTISEKLILPCQGTRFAVGPRKESLLLQVPVEACKCKDSDTSGLQRLIPLSRCSGSGMTIEWSL